MVITSSETEIIKFTARGFIFMGDMVYIPESATEEDINKLQKYGYEIIRGQ